MEGRRTGPLLLLLLGGFLALLGRLGQIQLFQHDVWSEEAAGLLHDASVLPYRRGTILDGAGRVLVRDRESYHLVFTYRDFRRGHPLGQVAHARSALELRPVPLAEAAGELVPWAERLVALTPAAVRDFGEGAGLELPGLTVPAAADPAGERRGSRASDLHFYVSALLGVRPGERSRVSKARRDARGDASYLELVASLRAGVDPDDLREELRERLATATQALELLGRELRLAEEDPGPDPAGLLIERLERERRRVEDSAASRLFADVLGYPVGRLDARLIEDHVDLDWLAVLLAWDGIRLEQWLGEARAGWLDWRDRYALPYLLADLRQVPRESWTADRVLDLAASLYPVSYTHLTLPTIYSV